MIFSTARTLWYPSSRRASKSSSSSTSRGCSSACRAGGNCGGWPSISRRASKWSSCSKSIWRVRGTCGAKARELRSGNALDQRKRLLEIAMQEVPMFLWKPLETVLETVANLWKPLETVAK